MNKKKPTLWGSQTGGLRSKTNPAVPLSPHRKGRRGVQPSSASHQWGLHAWVLGYLKGLRRPAIPKVSCRENQSGSTNQNLNSILQNSGFQINYLESKRTRKPHSLLNLNIIDSVVSFESQKWTHFGTGSRDCFSILLRNKRITLACGPALAGPILSFRPACMIVSRCAVNHHLEDAANSWVTTRGGKTH